MLGKTIWDTVAQFLSKELSMSLDSVEHLMMYFPTKPKRLFAVPRYGWKLTMSKGQTIADAFQKAKDQFGIKFLRKEEFFKEYDSLKNFIDRTEYKYEEKLSNLANELSKGLNDYTPGFDINSKMILLFLEKKEMINIDKHGCYAVTNKGIKMGFKAENRMSMNDCYSILIYDEKGFKFIRKSLPPIIYTYYAKNPLNIYHNHPNKEFEVNLAGFDPYDAKIRIDRILNYKPLAEKYTSRLSTEDLSLALSTLNFVASIIDPESNIKEFVNYIGLKTKASSNFYCLICNKLTLRFNNKSQIELKNVDKNKIIEFVDKYKEDFSFEKARIQMGLIFDLDGTVFDTNCIRDERRNHANCISTEKLNKIQLVEGFESLFLDENSEFCLKNNKILFITSSPEAYAKYLLKLHGLDGFECHYSCSMKKSKLIVDFVKRSGLKNFIAFGDEEKDAQLYSQCNIPFYIVNKYYGYDNKQDLLANVIIPNEKDFRHEFMYDIIKKKCDLNTKYFDDFIVYYCRYYDKTDCWGICPDMPGRKIFEKIKFSEFKNKKSEYVRNHLQDLIMNDYNNIHVSIKNAVFARVPGHDETSFNPNSPCSILIKELSRIYGSERDYSDFLKRNSAIMNHDYGRNIKDHIDTIVSIPSKKIEGKTVYLFDDVVTTGTQMSACIEKLYSAGAGHVVCFCICRTCPPKRLPLNEIEGGCRNG